MKKILIFLFPVLLTSNMSIFMLQKNNLNDNQVIWNLNINETKQFPKDTKGESGIVGNKIFTFDFLNYASSLNAFVTKYPHFVFNNGNYLHAVMYTTDKTDYLSQVYNTSELLSPSGYVADSLLADYNFGGAFYALVQLSVSFGIVNNKLSFGVSYDISSPRQNPVVPLYSVSISNLNFLPS